MLITFHACTERLWLVIVNIHAISPAFLPDFGVGTMPSYLSFATPEIGMSAHVACYTLLVSTRPAGCILCARAGDWGRMSTPGYPSCAIGARHKVIWFCALNRALSQTRVLCPYSISMYAQSAQGVDMI